MIATARAKNTTQKTRRPWAPDAKDHLVYQLVKFGGQTQSTVASMQRISQATVSRIIDRYERWQAHADPREGGRLDPAERLRAQRWLTYERNELILASALRIADRMEGITEMWKTVRTEPTSPYLAERGQERTETEMTDRHGVAARFLRLAFRINMEQLKLVAAEAPPMPEPLSAEELAEQERQSAEIAEEFRALQEELEAAAAEPLAGTTSSPEETAQEDEVAVQREQVCSRLVEVEAEASAPESEDPMHEVNNVHNGSDEKIAPITNPACSCAADVPAEEIADDACISPDGSPADCERTNPPRAWAGPQSLATSAR